MSKSNEPMDVTFAEDKNPTPKQNQPRVCWAAKTLIAEVLALFPETPVETSNIDGRNTALDVSFDMTVLDHEDRVTFTGLMIAMSEDERIWDITTEDDSVLVSFKSNPRTQDSREPFGLDAAYLVLVGEEGSL